MEGSRTTVTLTRLAADSWTVEVHASEIEIKGQGLRATTAIMRHIATDRTGMEDMMVASRTIGTTALGHPVSKAAFKASTALTAGEIHHRVAASMTNITLRSSWGTSGNLGETAGLVVVPGKGETWATTPAMAALGQGIEILVRPEEATKAVASIVGTGTETEREGISAEKAGSIVKKGGSRAPEACLGSLTEMMAAGLTTEVLLVRGDLKEARRTLVSRAAVDLGRTGFKTPHLGCSRETREEQQAMALATEDRVEQPRGSTVS